MCLRIAQAVSSTIDSIASVWFACESTMGAERRFQSSATAEVQDVVTLLENYLTPSVLERCSKEHHLFLGYASADDCTKEHSSFLLHLQQKDPYVKKTVLQEALVLFDAGWHGQAAEKDKDRAREGQAKRLLSGAKNTTGAVAWARKEASGRRDWKA